jgi:L-iditol 2-dehydrogenase
MKNDTTMQALVLHAIGDLRLDDIPRPVPARGSVLVDISACGVCGSDLPRVYHKGTYSFPLVPGHEFAGVISALGPGVEDWRVGDRVAVFPLLWCGRCAACEQGKYVMCQDYDYLGSRSNGAFAECVVVPVRNLVRVPPGVTLEEAAMAEPAAVALHALRRGGGTTAGETVAIFGAGPIGLMLAMWARSLGATQILIFDVMPRKIEMAHALGFEHTYDSRQINPVQQIEATTGGAGAHLCLEAAGVPATMQAALAATRRNGRCVLMGNPSAEVALPAALISQCMRREIQILGTWNSEYSACGNDDDWTTALAAMRQGKLNLKPLITHRVALRDGVAAFEMIRQQSEFSSKVLIHP